MLLKLNLLPPSEKKKIKLSKLARLIISFELRVCFLIIVFSLLMVSVFLFLYILTGAQANLVEQTKSNQKVQELFEMEEKIKNANISINQIRQKQDEMIVWTPVLEHLSEITPNGIYLKTFSFVEANGEISLSGHADKREDLLKYKGLLKESDYFESVESPLSNIIKKEDISFSFTIIPTGVNKKNEG